MIEVLLTVISIVILSGFAWFCWNLGGVLSDEIDDYKSCKCKCNDPG